MATQYTAQQIVDYAKQQGWYDPAVGITNPQGVLTGAIQFGVPIAQIEQAFGMPAGSATKWLQDNGYGSLLQQAQGGAGSIAGLDQAQTAYKPKANQFTSQDIVNYAQQQGFYDPQKGVTNPYGLVTGALQYDVPLDEIEKAFGMQAGDAQKWLDTAGIGSLFTQPSGGSGTGGTGGTQNDVTRPPVVSTPINQPTTEDLDPSQSTLSPNFGEYVYNMLGRGEALTNLPYQEYTGERFAGPSELQNRAFGIAGGLDTSPEQFETATRAASSAAERYGNLAPYTASNIQVERISPTSISSTYQAPGAYQAGTFGVDYTPGDFSEVGKYEAPDAYKNTTFDTGLGAVKSVEEYMNPYQQSVTDIEKRELARQAEIARNAEQARLSQAGAYGGSRQAIMEAERQRNLMQQMGDVQTKGSQAAFDRALAQRLKESGLSLEAQRGTEQSRQFGYGQEMTAAELKSRYGLDAAKAGEMAKQFAANQQLESQRLGEQSRQYGYGQQMTAADLQARYGLDAQRANQLASLQAQQANQQAGLDAARLNESSRQYGAGYGLQGLAGQLSAANTLGGLGTSSLGAQISGLNSLMNIGGTQQGFMQQPLDFGYQQWQESIKDPYQKTTFMQSLLSGLPLAAQPYNSGDSGLGALLQGGMFGAGLYNLINTQGGGATNTNQTTTNKPPGT